MLNFNLFEQITLKLFCCGAQSAKEKEEKKIDADIQHASIKYNISILPVSPNFNIDNLYPITDHVELWNIFIIGNDKTYISVNINDPHIKIPHANELPNKKAQNLLPDDLANIFDSIWTKTLKGKQLQFYMLWNNKLYFINTYPFLNGVKSVIGAILFMRAFDSSNANFNENALSNHYSIEMKNEIEKTGARSSMSSPELNYKKTRILDKELENVFIALKENIEINTRKNSATTDYQSIKDNILERGSRRNSEFDGVSRKNSATTDYQSIKDNILERGSRKHSEIGGFSRKNSVNTDYQSAKDNILEKVSRRSSELCGASRKNSGIDRDRVCRRESFLERDISAKKEIYLRKDNEIDNSYTEKSARENNFDIYSDYYKNNSLDIINLHRRQLSKIPSQYKRDV